MSQPSSDDMRVVPSFYIMEDEYMDETIFAEQERAWKMARDERESFLLSRPVWVPRWIWRRRPQYKRLVAQEEITFKAYQQAYAVAWDAAAWKKHAALKPPFPGKKDE